ncbi:MAG: lysylphosphatidylglycerol synthase transmembrane domain-containing protein [Pseudomonadota bacterium]
MRRAQLPPVFSGSFWRYALALTALAASVVLLVWISDPAPVLAVLRQADWIALGVAAPCVIVLSWLARGIRWFSINAAATPGYGPLRAYLDNALGQSLAEITPAQSGEALKIVLASRAHPGQSAGFAAMFALERAMDTLVFGFIVMIPVVLMGAGWLPGAPSLTDWLAILCGFILMGGLLIGLYLIHGQRLSGYLKRAWGSVLQLGLRRFGTALLLTVINWALIVLKWRIALSAVGLDPSWMVLCALMGLVTLASLASLLPSGLGLGDATLAGLLLLTGSDPATAIVGAAAVRLLSFQILAVGVLHLGGRWMALRSGL